MCKHHTVQNQKTTLFHINTEVFAYNSIKNRHEILTKSLYATCCVQSFHLQRLHKLRDDVAIDLNGVIHPRCCSSSHYTVIRCCRSSSMSCTLLWYTRSCITDHMIWTTGFRSRELGGHMSGAMKSGVLWRSSSIVSCAWCTVLLEDEHMFPMTCLWRHY